MAKSYPAYIKQKAIDLRTDKKMTLGEIVDRLKIPKTTVYGWIKDIPIPRTNAQTEAQRRGTQAMQAKYAKIRDDAYQQGLAEAQELLKNPMFRDFVTLYVAEGYKRGRNDLSVANSDVKVVAICYYWMKKFSKRKVGFYIQTHADLDDSEVKVYWAKALKIEPSLIQIIRKSNSGKLSGRQWRSQYGVLTVRTADTALRARLQGWIDYLEKQWLDFAQELL